MTDFTLVTGASSGLGEAFALIAAREKRSVIIAGRHADRLEPLAERLRAEGAGEVRVIAADLGLAEDRERLWREAAGAGVIDVLVNAAGLRAEGAFAEGDWDREAASIEIDVVAMTWLMKQAVRHMVENRRGRILNVASVAAFVPGPSMAVFHATQAYAVSLSEAVAEELAGTDVSVTVLCAGDTGRDGAEVDGDAETRAGNQPTAMEVAREGWSGMKARSRVVIPGALNKLSALGGRVLPRALSMKATKAVQGMSETGESPIERVQAAAEQARAQAAEAAGAVRTKAAEWKDQVLSPESDFSEAIRKRASEWRTRVQILGEKASDGLSRAVQATTTAATNAEEGSMAREKQAEQMRSGKGFVAALDQSGGSTPKALKLYGIDESEYSGEAEMFDLIHAMRARIVNAPAFSGEKVIGAILFEMTMDRAFGGKPAAQYLWEDKGVVPFLKCDKGLLDEADGVQLMKPMADLDDLLSRAVAKGIFGTKMRSVINAANPAGIKANVAQQFEVGEQILGHGLVPIIEPEVNIKIADKAEAEAILRDELLAALEGVSSEVMLKLSLPSEAGFYAPLIAHPKVMRVVALSGGYSRDEANRLLAENHGMIASFSRALTEGLSAQQSDDEFNATIAETIDSIYRASIT